MFNRTIIVVAMSFAFLVLLPDSVYASGSMRCGTHIVSAGQRHGPSMFEVLKKCGEPTQRMGNTWYYDRPGNKQYIVVFDPSGRLMRIE